MTELTAGLTAGMAAPDFALPIDCGKVQKLSSLKGRAVALFFYPKDDTTGCTLEAIDFSTLRAKFNRAGTVVLGMSPDPVKKHRKFKIKHGLNIDLVADETHATLEAYGVWTQKSMYGVKYMGVERSTFLIDREGNIAQVWRKVSVPGHAQEVLEAAKALRAAS